MFNVLLDELPTEWNGYKINTDFRIGIMISQCICDNTLSEREKYYTVSNLLFQDEMPSDEECSEAIVWFMNDYNRDHVEKKDGSKAPVMDFDQDQWRIYSAFLNQYNIDLNTVEMHWFVFMGLLGNLADCQFTQVIEIRGKKITSKMQKEEKEYYKKLKKVYQIKEVEDEHPHSLEEERAINEFMKFVNANNNEPSANGASQS